LSTKLSDIEMRVVNDTLKTTIEVKPDYTYESLKEQVIELSKDKETNKEQIEVLREELSAQRKAFLASDDTILIKTADETLLLYRDEEGILQPASAQIDKIVEHRDVATFSEKEIVDDVTNWNIKFGAYYDITKKSYGVILSKELIGIKDYTLNISLLSDMLSLEGLKIGADVGYCITNDIEFGIGINSDKDIYVKLQYEF